VTYSEAKAELVRAILEKHIIAAAKGGRAAGCAKSRDGRCPAQCSGLDAASPAETVRFLAKPGAGFSVVMSHRSRRYELSATSSGKIIAVWRETAAGIGIQGPLCPCGKR
jgi:hypothetical protein